MYHNSRRYTEKQEKILSRILWLVIIVLFTLAVVRIVFQFFVTPGVKINNIVLEGNVALAEDQILRIAGIEKNKYYFKLDLPGIKAALEKVALVKEATVSKVFPDTLKVGLVSRTPVAIALAGNAEKSIPIAFDDEGIIIMVGNQINYWDLPVISGLKFNSFQPGIELPAQLHAFLKDMRVLKDGYPELYGLISEIKVEPVGALDYELVLHFLSFRTAVRVGRKLQGEQLGYAMMVLDVLEKENLAHPVAEIDFRTNEVVYTYE